MPYTPTAISPNGEIFSDNGGTLFALGGYSNYTINAVASANPAVVGNSITLTTTLASTSGGPTPTGTITYTAYAGANSPLNYDTTPISLGTASLSDGVASLPLSASKLSAAHYHVIASYSGDSTYSAGQMTFVLPILATTTTSVSASANPVAAGSSVTLTATVTPTSTSFVPLGTVTFMDGSIVLGTVGLNPFNGEPASNPNDATFTVSSLPAGTDAITAIYSGDQNFDGGTSATLPVYAVSVTNPGTQNNAVGDAVSLQISVIGLPSGNLLSFAATGLPSGLSINPSSGLIIGTITGTANSYSASVSVGDSQFSVSQSFTWNVSTVTVIATQLPPGVLAGCTFGLTVDAVNAQNQLDTSYNGTVTLSLANNPGNSVLGGTLSVQASGGVATFSGLTISNPGLAYTLQVSATGATPITTSAVDVAGYQLVASGTAENLVWYGTSGSDQVQFIQTATGTVQINVNELASVAMSFTATITGVTGSVVATEYDVAGDADVVDGSGLTTIASDITVGDGNDTVIGGGGANTVIAGDGDSTIYGNGMGSSPNPSGVEDPSNTITVGNGNNIIYGNYSGNGYRGGNNTITAGDGNNTIYGNYGNGGYHDGGEGSNNTITVGNGDNTIYGNYGTADGGEGGSNTIIAGNGNDVIYGNANGNDPQRLCGSNFIQVGNGNDTIYGNLGGDGGEGGNNTILTGSGQDTIYGNFGGDGGEGGNNLIVAGGGNDTIYAHCALPVSSGTSGKTAEGQDLIIGGTGADTVHGWPAGYTLGATRATYSSPGRPTSACARSTRCWRNGTHRIVMPRESPT